MKWTDDLVKQGSKLTKAGKVGMTPGMEKTLVGEMAKAGKTRLGTSLDVAKDVLKGVPNQVLKQTVGVNPKDVAKGSAYGGKAVVDVGAKTIKTTKDLNTGQEAGQIGGDQDADETRDNLDMGQ